MRELIGSRRRYDWGSATSIPDFLGEEPTGEPLAELWFGAHPTGPALADGAPLDSLISENPEREIGPSARYAFGDRLPYMMKLIAPERPLSLQAHPSKAQATAGYLQEPRDAAFRDPNHKPELLLALTDFTALVGFTVRRKARELLKDLDTPLAYRLARRLRLAAGRGMRPVVSWLLDSEDGPSKEEVQLFSLACEQRLQRGHSPFPLLDSLIGALGRTHPGDPAVTVAFLMNPVKLAAGEALYIPPQTLHSYQHGFAIEVMANSDNVIRAGLTSKPINPGLLLDTGVFDAHPPLRIAPEKTGPNVSLFNAPVEDFELAVATVDQPSPLPGSGPRIILALEGNVEVACRRSSIELTRGKCVFVSDADGPIVLSGSGQVAQCSVP